MGVGGLYKAVEDKRRKEMKGGGKSTRQETKAETRVKGGGKRREGRVIAVARCC